MNKENIYQDLKDIAVELQAMEKDIVLGTVTNLQISNSLNSFRMVLEHAVFDAAVKYGYHYTKTTGKKKNIYFPYCTKPDEFSKKLGGAGLNGLETDNPKLLELIENQQPYKCGSGWLVDLFNLSNDSKHQGHKGRDKSPSGFSVGGGFFMDDKSKNVLITGAEVNGVRMPDVHFRDKNNFRVKGPNENLFQVVNSVTFFTGTKIKVIPFFRECYLRVKHFIDAFYPILEK